jgi:hypothetical protein
MCGLFITRAFTVVSIICIVTNPHCVTGFDIIQDFTTALISNIYIYGYYMQTGLVKNK